MSKCESDTKYDRSLLIGLKRIAAYCGFTEMTIRKWIRSQAFPAGMLPDGRWATSTEAIDQWLQARNRYHSKFREPG